MKDNTKKILHGLMMVLMIVLLSSCDEFIVVEAEGIVDGGSDGDTDTDSDSDTDTDTDSDVDECDDADCDTPPYDECVGGELHEFSPEGECEDGECGYDYSVVECEQGDCIEAEGDHDYCPPDPCEGVVCDDAPDAYCDSTSFSTTKLVCYYDIGTCVSGQNGNYTCEYQIGSYMNCQDPYCTFSYGDSFCSIGPETYNCYNGQIY